MFGILNKITYKYLCGDNMNIRIFLNKEDAITYIKNLYPYYNIFAYEIVKLKNNKVW